MSEGDSKEPTSWSGKARQCTTTKVVKYKCGCSVVLGGFDGKTDAPLTCDEHHELVSSIITTERFHD